jgi:hypothetical protein
MSQYSNERWGFELTLPEGWSAVGGGFLRKVLLRDRGIWFHGPAGERLVIHPGPLLQKLDFSAFRTSFQQYLSTRGYNNVRFGILSAAGGEQNAACYSLLSGQVRKKYSVVVGNTEFAISAELGRGDIDDDDILEREELYDRLVLSMRVQ